VSETRPPADPFETLLKRYYGGPHHHRHRRRQPVLYGHGRHLADGYRPARVDERAERLLANYYGRPRHSHHRDHADRRAPATVSLSMDDGETLAPVIGEEYVVQAAFGEAAFEEYVIEQPGISGEASLDRTDAGRDADPQDECLVDIGDPLGMAKAADCACHAPAPAKAQTPATEAPTSPSPAVSATQSLPAAPPLPEPDTAPPLDDDFISDMQAILSRQKVFDPVTKKTVDPGKLAGAASADPQPGPGEPANNSQAIFDQIAESMQYANKYDLGTVELENRFADFDRISDLEHQANAKKRAAPSDKAAAAMAMAVDSQDFIHDLDAMQGQRGALATQGSDGDSDPFAFVPPAPDDPAAAGTMPGVTAPAALGPEMVPAGAPPAAMPAIQLPGIPMPAFQLPAAPASESLSTSTDLGGPFITGALQTHFATAADIDGYFARQGASSFIDWFNHNLAGRAPWEHRAIGNGAQVAANFKAIWDRIPHIFGSAQINLLQFLSLMSIMINEVGATLGPVAEKVGTHGHPGLAYAFDIIPGLKRSYNDGGPNWTAYRCFRDPDFIAAHGAKALGTQLQNTSDTRWSGHAYPDGYPTDPNPAVAGFIMEADFYKFRGRGLIQTTWRGAYLNLIRFVQGYTGAQSQILARQNAWAGMDPDKAANASSNADWDALFMDSALEIACVAIAQHSAGAGHYLDLATDAAILNGKGSGSIWRIGNAISGSQPYAELFRRRCVAACNLLGN
jgi:hypothetical protein